MLSISEKLLASFGFTPAPRTGPLAVLGAPKGSSIFDHSSGDELSIHKNLSWDIFDEEGEQKKAGRNTKTLPAYLAKNYKTVPEVITKSKLFDMVYNVQVKNSVRSKVFTIQIEPTLFHKYVKSILKQRVDAVGIGRKAQLQSYLDHMHLHGGEKVLVFDWSLDDVEVLTLNDQLKASLVDHQTPKQRSTDLKLLATAVQKGLPAAAKQAAKIVRVLSHKEAIAFDSRYKTFDPMILVVGSKKDVIASLESITTVRVAGVLISKYTLVKNEVPLDGMGESTKYGPQVDVDRKNDFRLVIFR